MSSDFWRNKKVFITGHTGFKGTWLSLWLQSLGANVGGFALAMPTTPNMFSLLRLEKSMESHIGDVREFVLIHKVMNNFKPDVVFHLAAQPLVRYSYQHPVDTYSTNVMGTVHVLEVAKTCDSVKVVVNITTDKCYENKEWCWGYREHEPLGGFDPYSNSKACSELVTSAYRNSFYQQKNIGLASARAGNVIGGGDWSQDRLIADVMKSMMTNKTAVIRNPNAIRPWQYVLEPLQGYLLLAEELFSKPRQFSGAWNFGPYTHESISVESVVKKIFCAWTQKNTDWIVQHNPEDLHEAHFLKLDISKAVTQLHWKPKLNIDAAIEWTVNWYQACMRKVDMHQFSLEQITKYETL